MNKLPLILLIVLLGMNTSAKAQVSFTYDSTNYKSDKWIDSIKMEYNKYKEHLISTELLKPNWLKIGIGFNAQCDTLFFLDNYNNLQRFNQRFTNFLLSKSPIDTIVLRISFGDNLSIGQIFKSFEILANSIDKNTGHGIYYFKANEPSKEKLKYVKTDTIDLFVNKFIKYNGTIIKKVNLSSNLQNNKPEIVILRVHNKIQIQDLVYIMQIGNKLKIKMVLAIK